jgi:AraC-like DNA-binding protein
METAVKLLTGTHLKLAVITRRLGLADTSQFVALFRREIGLTPAAYRAKLLEPRRTQKKAQRIFY